MLKVIVKSEVRSSFSHYLSSIRAVVIHSVTSWVAKIFLWNTCWQRKPIHHGTTFNGKVTTICWKFEKNESSWCCKDKMGKKKVCFSVWRIFMWRESLAWTSCGWTGMMGLFDVIVDVNGALMCCLLPSFSIISLKATGISRISQRDLNQWKYCIFDTQHQHWRGSLIKLINGLK